MFDNWTWPQYTMIALMALTLLIKVCIHDKPIKINGWAALCDFLTVWMILYFGKFWS